MKQNKQSGFTMIELMIVILIVGVLIYMAYGLFAPLFGGANKTAEAANVQALTYNIRSDFRGTSDYSSLSVGKLIARQRVPEKMVVSTTALKNGWEGDVTITGAPGAFTINWPNTPVSQCMGFVSDLSQLFRNITVGGTPVKTNGAKLDTNALDTACAGGGASEVTVTFVGS